MKQRGRTIIAALITVACVLAAVGGSARADTESAKLTKYKPAVDRAVDKALDWCVRNQRPNGSFPGTHGQTNAVVGLTGMAFLSKGQTPNAGPRRDALNQCIDYVLSTPGDNGYVGVRGGRMYGHGIATLFLSEVSGMVDPSRQKKIDALLPKALKVILTAQDVPKEGKFAGGWRYEPTSNDSDISVTGWQMMALRSARLNGAPVPKAAIDRAIGFIGRCKSRAGDGGFFYQEGKFFRGHPFRGGIWLGGPSTPARTGAALLCRELAGHHGDAVNIAAGDFILRVTGKQGSFIKDDWHEYATYYCAQGMFQLGGKYWEQFGEAMYQYLLASQQGDGAWRTKNGAAYPTAMYTLALTVSYRQLPIYQR